MRKYRYVPALLAVLAFGLWTNCGAGQGEKPSSFPKCVLIIRHGEKVVPSKGDIHLNEAGQARAKKLHELFMASSTRTKPFPMPDFIFAARNSENSHRPLETVQPFAAKLKRKINQDFHSIPKAVVKKGETIKGDAELAAELFTNPIYKGKTVLISWRHGNLPELAKALKATNAPAKWADEVFDRVWQITYDKAGQATFVNAPQRLMPGDAEK